MAIMQGTSVNPISKWTCEVVGKFGSKHHVLLDDKKCTCKYFDRIKIPCGHAMLAADMLGIPSRCWLDTSTRHGLGERRTQA